MGAQMCRCPQESDKEPTQLLYQNVAWNAELSLCSEPTLTPLATESLQPCPNAQLCAFTLSLKAKNHKFKDPFFVLPSGVRLSDIKCGRWRLFGSNPPPELCASPLHNVFRTLSLLVRQFPEQLHSLFANQFNYFGIYGLSFNGVPKSNFLVIDDYFPASKEDKVMPFPVLHGQLAPLLLTKAWCKATASPLNSEAPAFDLLVRQIAGLYCTVLPVGPSTIVDFQLINFDRRVVVALTKQSKSSKKIGLDDRRHLFLLGQHRVEQGRQLVYQAWGVPPDKFYGKYCQSSPECVALSRKGRLSAGTVLISVDQLLAYFNRIFFIPRNPKQHVLKISGSQLYVRVSTGTEAVRCLTLMQALHRYYQRNYRYSRVSVCALNRGNLKDAVLLPEAGSNAILLDEFITPGTTLLRLRLYGQLSQSVALGWESELNLQPLGLEEGRALLSQQFRLNQERQKVHQYGGFINQHFRWVGLFGVIFIRNNASKRHELKVTLTGVRDFKVFTRQMREEGDCQILRLSIEGESSLTIVGEMTSLAVRGQIDEYRIEYN